MQRRRFLTTAVAAMHGLAFGGLRAGAQTSGRATSVPIALGAYVSGAPDNPALLDQFTALVGVTPAVVMWFQDWAHGGFDPIRMNAVAARGAIPQVTWEPWDYTNGTNQPAYALATILAGTYDAYIQEWAHDAARWGKPFSLRFAHEMNGDWYPWSVGVNGNTAAQYIATWKHVRAIFRTAGATNARWVWCPNIGGTNNGTSTGSAVSYRALYPGDAAVDWVALDGYNWGTTQSWSTWQEIGTVFGDSYTALAALTAKPMMIAETASAEQGGSKVDWITAGFGTALPVRFPRVRAVIWFDERKESDWRVNSSPASLAAYRTIAQSAAYQGRLA